MKSTRQTEAQHLGSHFHAAHLPFYTLVSGAITSTVQLLYRRFSDFAKFERLQAVNNIVQCGQGLPAAFSKFNLALLKISAGSEVVFHATRKKEDPPLAQATRMHQQHSDVFSSSRGFI